MPLNITKYDLLDRFGLFHDSFDETLSQTVHGYCGLDCDHSDYFTGLYLSLLSLSKIKSMVHHQIS